MKTSKSSEQRFGHVNATNRNSYLNMNFYLKFGLLGFLGFQKPKKLVFKTHFYSPVV